MLQDEFVYTYFHVGSPAFTKLVELFESDRVEKIGSGIGGLTSFLCLTEF